MNAGPHRGWRGATGTGGLFSQIRTEAEPQSPSCREKSRAFGFGDRQQEVPEDPLSQLMEGLQGSTICPPETSLWHKVYFALKKTQGPKDLGRNFHHPLN